MLAPCASVLGKGGREGAGIEVPCTSILGIVPRFVWIAGTRRRGRVLCECAGCALSTCARIGDSEDIPGAAHVERVPSLLVISCVYPSNQ